MIGQISIRYLCQEAFRDSGEIEPYEIVTRIWLQQVGKSPVELNLGDEPSLGDQLIFEVGLK